jgi:hypothetical protein
VVLGQQICLHFGAGDFPFQIPFKKCFKIVFFFALAQRVLGAAALRKICSTKYFTVSIYLIALKYCLYINRRRSSLEAKKQFGSTF